MAAGAYYEGWTVATGAKVAPVLQLNATYRARDGGSEGDSDNTGYTRLLLMPGLEIDYRRMSITLDLGLPVHMNVNGDQLVSRQYWRLNVSQRF